MATVEHSEDRDALYYPFIHLRNEAWLRSALLFFPHVVRMTPPGYDINNSPFVQELAATLGRRDEPLVGSYRLDMPAANAAGKRLAGRFEKDVADAAFRRRYGRTATTAGFKNDSVFQIHRDKFANSLEQVLRKAES